MKVHYPLRVGLTPHELRIIIQHLQGKPNIDYAGRVLVPLLNRLQEIDRIYNQKASPDYAD
jgi:hypothetical protein